MVKKRYCAKELYSWYNTFFVYMSQLDQFILMKVKKYIKPIELFSDVMYYQPSEQVNR